MTTCQGNHKFKVIYRYGPEMEETVIRWCHRCGAIVGDIDVDGRTQPGGAMPLKLPATEEAKHGQS